MAGKITALKLQKRDKERVNVFLDDVYAFAVTVVVAARLRKGQYLSDEEIAALKLGDERDKAFHRAIRLLAMRPRSQAEVVRYLRDKGYTEEVVEDVVKRLLEQQYLDDEAFARFWLEDRERFRPKGERALRYELRQKGIADHIIDPLVADLDEEAAAWAALEKKLYQWRSVTKDGLKRKVISFLSRRGFNYEIANNAFRRACETLNIEDTSEFEDI